MQLCNLKLSAYKWAFNLNIYLAIEPVYDALNNVIGVYWFVYIFYHQIASPISVTTIWICHWNYVRIECVNVCYNINSC